MGGGGVKTLLHITLNSRLLDNVRVQSGQLVQSIFHHKDLPDILGGAQINGAGFKQLVVALWNSVYALCLIHIRNQSARFMKLFGNTA